MRLENVLALTHASLINEPCVSDFNNIVFDVKKVNRGDLFIAINHDEINQAVQNGAYGIVFDKPTQIIDSEIAWIETKNIEDALKRLLRFRLIEKEVVVYECDEIILKLAMQCSTDSNFIVVNGDIQKLYKNLWHIGNRSTLLFCSDLIDENLFVNIKSIPKNIIQKITIMEQTLFETSFIYENKFYERQLISPFFIPYLEKLFHLYRSLKINFKLKKFTPIENFEAVFTNKKFEIKEFGSSDCVLIFEPNIKLVKQGMDYLQNRAPWANIIYIIPQTMKSNHLNTFIYEQKNEIIDILKKNKFNFAFIVGADKNILHIAKSNQKQLILEF
ncbi:MAG: hypothetical protein L3I99_03270 [Sulfurimonas sp.]|nr:hypothetical protein [Sulfurimonas sp.]